MHVTQVKHVMSYRSDKVKHHARQYLNQCHVAVAVGGFSEELWM